MRSAMSDYVTDGYDFWDGDDELRDWVFERPPPRSCSNCPDWIYISNPSCEEMCMWGVEQENCISCICMGAWILCPCFIFLRGGFTRYGEDFLQYERQKRQWEKRTWLIVHPKAVLQGERNTFRAAQLWKVIRVSDLLTLIGTFYSAAITIERPVAEW